jgi:acetyl esterase/lipase
LGVRRIAVALIGAAAAVGLVAAAIPAAGARQEITVENDVVYRTVGGQQLVADVYLPAGDGDDRPAVLLVHGGGWVGGDKRSLEQQGMQLAEAGFVAVSVSYHFAPDHPYPAAVDDVVAAVKWLRKKPQRQAYGIDPDRIGAIGSSAGGHLVGMLATLGDGKLDQGARIAAAVSWSGPMDLTTVAAIVDGGNPLPQGSAITTFLGCQVGDCPAATAEAASPFTHVDRTDAPTLLANSDAELVPLALVEPMVDALEAAGVEHELVVYPGNRHARALLPDVWPPTLAFLDEHLEP